MSSRTQFIIKRLRILEQRIVEHDPFDRLDLGEEEQDFLEKWNSLTLESSHQNLDFYFEAQELICRLIRCYPNLVPLMHRETLYFVGGECLHYLGDEELSFYQEIDEQIYELEAKNEEIDLEQILEANRKISSESRIQ